jgi:uridine kinase
MPILTVEIDAEGNTKVKVEGVVGSGCTDLAKGIEEALGKVETVTPTSDFYRRAQQQQKASGR